MRPRAFTQQMQALGETPGLGLSQRFIVLIKGGFNYISRLFEDPWPAGSTGAIHGIGPWQAWTLASRKSPDLPRTGFALPAHSACIVTSRSAGKLKAHGRREPRNHRSGVTSLARRRLGLVEPSRCDGRLRSPLNIHTLGSSRAASRA